MLSAADYSNYTRKLVRRPLSGLQYQTMGPSVTESVTRHLRKKPGDLPAPP
jgi:hypothetical protein